MASIETRKAPSGDTIYRVKVRRKGYPVQSASFKRLTDARKWGQGVEAAILEGRHFKGNETKKHSLAETIDRYTKEVLPHKAKAGANQKAQLSWWKEKLGHCLLADVSSALIVEQRNRLLQEPKAPKCKNPPEDAIPKLRSPATVVRYLSALSHVFSTAMKEWEPKPIIPASAKVANFPPADKRSDAITPAQVRYIQRLIEESGTELQRVLDYCGVEKLEDIAKSEASRVIKSLEQSRDRRAA